MVVESVFPTAFQIAKCHSFKKLCRVVLGNVMTKIFNRELNLHILYKENFIDYLKAGENCIFY